MSTLESTIDKHPFPPKSREEIYKDLEISRQQAAEGKSQEMGQALAEIRENYHFS